MEAAPFRAHSVFYQSTFKSGVGTWAWLVLISGMIASPWLVPIADARPEWTSEPSSLPQSGGTPAGGNQTGQVLRQFDELLAEVRQTEGGSWEREAAIINAAEQRFFEQQDWSSEPDRFARDLTVEVTRVPPWNPQERLRKAVDLLQQRYNLTPEQAIRLQQVITQGVLHIGMKHSNELFAYGKDALASGVVGGAASDSQKMARWATTIQPVMKEAAAYVDEHRADFLGILNDQQRKVAQQDLMALDRRVRAGQTLVANWAAGQWRLEDSGLTPEMLDPQWMSRQLERQPAGANSREVTSARFRDSEVQALRNVDPDKPDAWTLYVQAFIRKYGLDAAQCETAYGILRELRSRAAEYFASHRTDLQDLDRQAMQASPERKVAIERQREALTQPVALLFQELKDRLEMLPTEGQRAALGATTLAQASQPTKGSQATPTDKQPTRLASPASQAVRAVSHREP